MYRCPPRGRVNAFGRPGGIDMDINTLRAVATVVSFVTFIGILVWAWSRSNKQSFDEAAQLPFDQE